MNAASQPGRPALATGVPVAIVVALHGAIGTAIILAVEPDVNDPVSYWLAAVLGPSLVWAVLVIARAAAWRRPSAFWLGASAGIVVLLAFLCSLSLLLLGIPSALRGTPLAMPLSAWLLLACSLAVSIGLRLLDGRSDEPVEERTDAAALEDLDALEAGGAPESPGAAGAQRPGRA